MLEPSAERGDAGHTGLRAIPYSASCSASCQAAAADPRPAPVQVHHVAPERRRRRLGFYTARLLVGFLVNIARWPEPGISAAR